MLDRDNGLLVTEGGILRKVRLAEFQKQIISIGDNYETIRTDLEPEDFVEDGIHFLFKNGAEKNTEQYKELATFLYGADYNEPTFLLPNSLDYTIMGDLGDDLGVYDPNQGFPEHYHDTTHTDIFNHDHKGLSMDKLKYGSMTGRRLFYDKLVDTSWQDLKSEFKGKSETTGSGDLEFSHLNVLRFVIAKMEQ